MLPMMATRLHSAGHVETTFRVMSAPVGCRDTHGRILARKLGGGKALPKSPDALLVLQDAVTMQHRSEIIDFEITPPLRPLVPRSERKARRLIPPPLPLCSENTGNTPPTPPTA
jgi:hypothetical protein